MEIQEPRELQYDGIHCNLTIQQFSGGLVVLKISGSDVGEFGDAPLLALTEWLTGTDSVDLYIDARDVQGASIEVSSEWAGWLAANKARLRGVGMLTGSSLIHVTAGFVRRFADLENVMRIYTEPAAFDAALAAFLTRSDASKPG